MGYTKSTVLMTKEKIYSFARIRHLLIFAIVVVAVLGLFSFFSASRADYVLYLSPARETYAPGEIFWLSIMVDTKGENVNAVAAYFSYPEDKLEVLGIDVEDSVIELWAEQDAKEGRVKIAGGTPTPGFSGIYKVGSVEFRVKASSGTVTLTFDDVSAVVTDADNRDILRIESSGKGIYSIK